MTVFILAVTAGFTGLFIHYQRGMLTRVLIRNGEVLSRIIARNARLAVISESEDLLREVSDTAFDQEGVTRMMVYNDQGDLLTWRSRTHPDGPAHPPDSRIVKAAAARIAGAATVYVREKANVVQFWSAVTPEGTPETEASLFLGAGTAPASSPPAAGWIGICVDKGELKQEFRELIRKAVLLGAVVWALTSAVVVFAIRRFTRPIFHLKAAAEGLESGAPVAPVAVGRRDELGELARAFDRMAGTIRAKEAALLASEEKYRSIVENATEGIFQTDLDGRIVMANPALATMLGYDSADGMVREGIDFLGHVRLDPDPGSRFPERISGGGHAASFETVCHRLDGGEVPVLVNAHGVRGTGGGVVLYEGLVQDISPWKRAERLKLAKEAAEASARAKSRFLAHMSHEIRTPLGAITGLVAVMGRSPDLSATQRAQLDKIDASAQTLLGIIEDILDFSRIEAGKLSLETTPFAWAPVSRQLAGLFVDRAREKGVELAFDYAPDFPDILVGSPLRLKQVLTNLIGNALKFTPRGGRVTVSGYVVDWQTEDQALVGFKVSDTGIGIPQDKLAVIFESFTQSDDSTSRRYGGTGLGLAICKQIVEMMGGRIQVVSGEEVGSDFSFTVPMAVGGDLPVQAVEAPSHPDLAGIRILVVEDHPINQEVVQNLLADEGIRVFLADSGPAALASVAETDFDAVLMDIQMPGMDGLETTRRIRAARPDRTGMPIIAMTAHALPEERDKCLAAGMVDVVTKPLDLKTFFSTLARWLQEGDAPPVRPAAASPPETVPEETGKAPFPATLPGIDVAEAMERLRGNRRLLGRLVGQLVAEYGDVADRLRALLSAGRRAEAQMIAHTLKGVAGNCAARFLYEVAAAIEARLHDGGEDPTPGEIDRLETAMAGVAAAVESLGDFIGPEAAPPPDAPADSPEDLADRFQALDTLLARHRYRAEAAFHHLADGLPDRRYSAPLKTLEAQLWQFQYRSARETLGMVAEMAGVGLGEG